MKDRTTRGRFKVSTPVKGLNRHLYTTYDGLTSNINEVAMKSTISITGTGEAVYSTRSILSVVLDWHIRHMTLFHPLCERRNKECHQRMSINYWL